MTDWIPDKGWETNVRIVQIGSINFVVECLDEVVFEKHSRENIRRYVSPYLQEIDRFHKRIF